MRSRLLLLAAALLFSTGGAAIKAATLTPWQVACFRCAVAGTVLFAVLPEARRGWSWRVVPVGAAHAATMLLFVISTRLTTAANAIFLQSTAPLYVMLLAPWLLKERLKRVDFLYGAAVAAGMSMFFLAEGAGVKTAPNPHLGNVLAAASGITWACTLLGLRWMGRYEREGGIPTVVTGNALAFLIALPMAVPVADISLANVLVIAYLGIFQIGIAYFCLTRAMRHVAAFEATALLLTEPALNPVWAWLAQGENPGRWAMAGGATILAATAAQTWWQSRTARV